MATGDFPDYWRYFQGRQWGDPQPAFVAEPFLPNPVTFNDGIEAAARHVETMGLKLTAREIRNLKISAPSDITAWPTE
jgi:hypothetical protein